MTAEESEPPKPKPRKPPPFPSEVLEDTSVMHLLEKMKKPGKRKS